MNKRTYKKQEELPSIWDRDRIPRKLLLAASSAFSYQIDISESPRIAEYFRFSSSRMPILSISPHHFFQSYIDTIFFSLCVVTSRFNNWLNFRNTKYHCWKFYPMDECMDIGIARIHLSNIYLMNKRLPRTSPNKISIYPDLKFLFNSIKL